MPYEFVEQCGVIGDERADIFNRIDADFWVFATKTPRGQRLAIPNNLIKRHERLILEHCQ